MGDEDRKGLMPILSRILPSLYAVIDGAHFGALPADLSRLGLTHRPLYFRRGSKEGVAEGPFMVSLPDMPSALSVIELVQDAAAAVFWSWPSGADELYDHLRHIAMIEIPSEPIDAPDPEYSAVLLRHGDPNALVAVLRVLDVVQYGQILGDAAGLVFIAREYGGLRTVPRPPDCPHKRRRGLVRLSPDQYKEMKGYQLERSRQRIMAYLRDVGGEDAAQLDDAALYAQLRAAEASGADLGLRSEAAHGQWAFLMLKTDGEMARGEPVRRALLQSDSPDGALEHMMREMVRISGEEVRKSARLPGHI